MPSQSYSTTFVVDQTPEESFAAITSVRGWWSGEIEGSTKHLGEEFTYHYQDVHYSKQRITELIPGRKIVWHVLDAYLNFTEDPDEWVGTDITFEVARKGDQTEVSFSHLGLVPSSNASTCARTPGASTSTAACKTSSPQAKVRPTPQRIELDVERLPDHVAPCRRPTVSSRWPAYAGRAWLWLSVSSGSQVDAA
jgi:hypothetical protein